MDLVVLCCVVFILQFSFLFALFLTMGRKTKLPRVSRSKGLEPLRPLDNIWIELILGGTDPRKKFTVRDTAGHVLFYVGERQENFQGHGRGRRFHMCLLTTDLTEVLNIYRKEVAIWWGCFCNPSCMERLKITNVSKERVLGSVEQVTKVSPGIVFEVKDSKGVTQLRLYGPGSNFSCCGFYETKFQIFDINGKQVGSIKQELTTVFAHNFHVFFPVQLDPKLKCILLSVCIMVSCRNNDLKLDGYVPKGDAQWSDDEDIVE